MQISGSVSLLPINLCRHAELPSLPPYATAPHVWARFPYIIALRHQIRFPTRPVAEQGCSQAGFIGMIFALTSRTHELAYYASHATERLVKDCETRMFPSEAIDSAFPCMRSSFKTRALLCHFAQPPCEVTR
jgi:hypothetical protein